jgi:hypothetical protein
MINNDFLSIIEEEKDFLIEQINNEYKNVTISNLPRVSENLELFLKGYLDFLLKKYSLRLFNLKSSEQNIFLLMENQEQLYTLKIESDILKHNTLCILLNPIGIRIAKKDINRFPIKIKSYGLIKQVVLYYPKNLEIKLDSINSLIINILETGYAWFKNKIENLVNNENISLSTNLYDYLKSFIILENIRKNLWFASITNEFGFRLIERNVALNLFEIIDNNSTVYGDSTNRFVSEMLSAKLPSEKLLMQKAIDNNEIINANISDSGYHKEGNIYSAAMSALYGTDTFTIHPILIDNNANVLLLYPTEHREFLEPIIEIHKNKLSKISKDSISIIHKTLTMFDLKNNVSTAKIGEFIGGFTNGFLGIPK